jgi:hypothetical protein
MLVLGAVGCVVGRKTLRMTLWMAPVCGLVFVLYARGDWMPRHRFFVPMLGFICLLVGYGFGELLRLARRSRVGVLVWCVVCGAVCIDYSRIQMFAGEPSRLGGRLMLARESRGFWFFDVPGQLSRRDYPLEKSALFILAHLPPGETICLRDIGFPGYLSMNPIWDTAGLVTPTAARARRDTSQEMRDALFAELRSVRPGCFRLVLPKNRPQHLNHRIHSWLETDPVARSLYQRVHPPPRIKKDASVVIYLRKDLPEVDYAERLRGALVRFPEYRDRIGYMPNTSQALLNGNDGRGAD